MAKAKMTSFVIDPKTEATIDEIRETIGATSNAEVMRRAIALMGIAAQIRTQDGKLLIKDKQGNERELLIS